MVQTRRRWYDRGDRKRAAWRRDGEVVLSGKRQTVGADIFTSLGDQSAWYRSSQIIAVEPKADYV